ncbi:NUDIX hydrolase [Streptomyces sp. N35]|uniref:NUDIX hydrolase n=1 Tax=Streptomyces sp. N35 TaxID=2795730 RepID=UPI0018F7278F|nr:NUDIX domain-containing protein [Streptomyces sp. N35]
MPISESHIRHTIANYAQRYGSWPKDLAHVTDLLGQGADPTSRKNFDGHLTASAVLVNDHRQVLHIRHKALGTLLRPGGHLEVDDTSLPHAALRELTEETGIPAAHLVDEIPVHVDAHTIPANDAKGEPEHRHIDFRFLFRTSGDSTVILQVEEVTGYTWVPLHQLEPRTLADRVTAQL